MEALFWQDDIEPPVTDWFESKKALKTASEKRKQQIIQRECDSKPVDTMTMSLASFFRKKTHYPRRIGTEDREESQGLVKWYENQSTIVPE